VLYGTAGLGPNRTVVVTPNDRGPTRTITADVILLATGSQPLRPPSIPFDDPRVFDSETLLELRHVPGSVLVVGDGAVGCEYASIFTALGVAVTLIDTADRLMSMMDGELSRLAARVCEGQGMRVVCGTHVCAVIGPRLATSLNPLHWTHPETFDPDRCISAPTSHQIDEARCEEIGFARCPFEARHSTSRTADKPRCITVALAPYTASSTASHCRSATMLDRRRSALGIGAVQASS
jgi:hypothetical protein